MSLPSLIVSDFPSMPQAHAGWVLTEISRAFTGSAGKMVTRFRQLVYFNYERGSFDDNTLESREIRISDHPLQGGRDCSDPDDPDDVVVYVGPYGDPARSLEEIAEIVRGILELDAI